MNLTLSEAQCINFITRSASLLLNHPMDVAIIGFDKKGAERLHDAAYPWFDPSMQSFLYRHVFWVEDNDSLLGTLRGSTRLLVVAETEAFSHTVMAVEGRRALHNSLITAGKLLHLDPADLFVITKDSYHV